MKKYINPKVETLEIFMGKAIMELSPNAKPGGGGVEQGDTPLSGAPKHRPF